MKKQLKRSSLITMLFFVFLISCGGEMEQKKMTYNSLKDIPDTTWEAFSKKTIFFGHQSVGNNIINGILSLGDENQNRRINVLQSENWAEIKEGAFAHAAVGKNMNPLSKIESFETFMNEGLGNKVDAAFYKFCYIDINKDTKVEELFNKYDQSLSKLKKQYPKTQFIHVTVPLTIVQTGLRVWIKNIIGRPIGGYADNAQRNRFNRMLRDAYTGKEPVFDLAAIESTFSDGSLSTYKYDGNTYRALVPGYASDGRHLNQAGSQRVAQALTLFLINTI